MFCVYFNTVKKKAVAILLFYSLLLFSSVSDTQLLVMACSMNIEYEQMLIGPKRTDHMILSGNIAF